MSNKKIITQQRRGTKEQWELTTEIPREGELVVEKNTVPKIKVGNGKSTYSELPYITDELEASIIEQKTRIDNIAGEGNPLEGSWEKEVQDIRTIGDKTYSCAGDAVRGIYNDVKDFIGESAVNGLEYNQEGDYMLYLTSNGTRVGNGVEVKGGTGGYAKVKLMNLLDSTTITTLPDSDTYIEFLYSSIEDGEPTGDYQCKIENNGAIKANLKLKQRINSITNEIEPEKLNIKDYINVGSNNLHLTFIDVYGTERSLDYDVNVIEMKISSTFSKLNSYNNKNDIIYKYKVSGFIDKNVTLYLDDNNIGSQIIKAEESDRTFEFLISTISNKCTHGTHILTVKIDTSDINLDIPPVEEEYTLLIIDDNESTPLLASYCETNEVKEGTPINISYMVYDTAITNPEVSLEIYDAEGNNFKNTLQNIDRSIQTWTITNYPVDQEVKFKITYTKGDTVVSLEHLVYIIKDDSIINIVPGYRVFLSSADRRNTDKDRDIWETEYQIPGQLTPTLVQTDFNGFNWDTNGWITTDGNTCLRISGGAKAVIKYQPFSSNNLPIGESGLTLEVRFAVRDVNNRNTVAFSCLSNDGAVGIKATSDTIILSSAENSVVGKYKDNEIITLAITISPSEPAIEGTGKDILNNSDRFMCLYMNGTLSSIINYTSASFNHDNYIEFGNIGCTVDLYSIRVYQSVLSQRDIINNYLSDITGDTRASLIAENNIYNNDGSLSYSEVISRIPTITFTGQMPTYKDDKKVVLMDFINPLDPSRSFKEVYGGPIPVEIDVQGTSSQFYVRKNWKIKLEQKAKDENGNTLRDENGKTIYNFKNAAYQHMKDQIPSKVFCIKVDYAEGTGTHNTQNANFVETLYTGLTKLPPQDDDIRVRTTIAGFPCVIYERSDESKPFIFSSKGNFNFDKGSEEAFGFTGDYETECWEFCNNDSDACKFLGNINRDWVDDFEPRYTPYSDEWDEIETLQKKKDDNVITDSEKVRLLDLRDLLINSSFKDLHDWVVSTKDDKVKFKNEFRNYFNFDYACIYYIYTFFALMVDQRAKNMFLTRWGGKQYSVNEDTNTWIIGDEDTGIQVTESNRPRVKNRTYWIGDRDTGIEDTAKWYPYFYDNDTCFGINNSGYWAFDYYHEDTDVVSDQYVYNGQLSTLWVNFREVFESEIRTKYQQLRSDKKLEEDKLLNQFIQNGSDRWSASIYNEDAEFKYVSMARPKNATEYESGKWKIDTGNLYQVKGDGASHLRYFLQNRFKYCDSKWQAGSYAITDNIIDLRVNTPTTQEGPSDDELDIGYNLNVGDKIEFYAVGSPNTTFNWYVNIDGVDQEYQSATTNENGNIKLEYIAVNDGLYQFKAENNINLMKPAPYDAEIAESIRVVPPSPSISITPFSNIYAAVRYKANGTLIKKRVTMNVISVFSPNGSPKYNDTETAIYGPSEIRSLGDLSALYCSKIKAGNATKLVELIVGNETAGYKNKMLSELEVGSSPLLETVNISNCVGLTAPLNLSNATNIKTILAKGSSITGINLPSSGYLTTLHAPNTLISLKLTNQPNLDLRNVTIGDSRLGEEISDLDISTIKSLWLTNIGDNIKEADGTINSISILEIANKFIENGKLEGLHLEGFTWNNCTIDDLKKLYKAKSEGGYGLRGIDAAGNITGKIYLAGICEFNQDLNGADVAEIQNHIEGIQYKFLNNHKIISTVYFHDGDYTDITPGSVLYSEKVYAYDAVGGSCNNNPILSKNPSKQKTIEYEYIWTKEWTTDKDSEVASPNVFNNILGDRHLYPVFRKTIREYKVTFICGAYELYNTTLKAIQGNPPVGTKVVFDINEVPDEYKSNDNLINLEAKDAGKNIANYELAGWYEVNDEGRLTGNILTNDTIITHDSIYKAEFGYVYHNLDISDFDYDIILDSSEEPVGLKVNSILPNDINLSTDMRHYAIKFEDTYQIDYQDSIYNLPIISIESQAIGAFVMNGMVPNRAEDNTLRTYIEAIDISNTRISEIPQYCFRFTEALQQIFLPNTLTVINQYSFAKSTISFLEIPASIEKIYPHILNSSNVTTIAIKSKEGNINFPISYGNLAFTGANYLTDIYVGWSEEDNPENYPWGAPDTVKIYYNQF